jgi:hypothetical protein
MILDLLYPHQIRQFIFDCTGKWVSKYAIKKWIKSGEIESFILPNRKRATRKCMVTDFIRRNACE